MISEKQLKSGSLSVGDTKERERGLTIYSWNVNGLRAVLRKGVLQEFLARKSPDILCLQEIKARSEQVPKGELAALTEDYEIEWNPAMRGGYSGTATLVRKGLEYERVELEGEEEWARIAREEGRVLILKFPEFFLVNVYTPNSKGDLSRLGLREKEWDPGFLRMLKKLESERYVVTCGDFNAAHKEIDLARPAQNHHSAGFTDEERRGVSAMLSEGLIDTFREINGNKIQYTWWSARQRAREKNVGWRIDYFFVSEGMEGRLREAKILEQVMGSDHCPVMIEVGDE